MWRACAAMLGILALATGVEACSSDNCSFSTTSFVVFQANAPTSAVPVCTDVAGGGLFAGAPPLSEAALAQCSAICPAQGGFNYFQSEAASNTPCCLSQWEPQTVVCTPPCTP